MPNEFKGSLQSPKCRVAIVAGRFNDNITNRLLAGALKGLSDLGVAESAVDIFWVPGAFEIPGTAGQIISRGLHQGVITLGCVIRGDTAHFDYVAGESARGILELTLASDVPVMYGVLTTENTAQAMERSADPPDNKGYDAAHGLIEMISLYGAIDRLQ